jgi:ribosome-associated protein
MHSDHDIPDAPSRSQHKREAEALQQLGEGLVGLPHKQLTELPLPDNLRDAIELARRLTNRGALRRQHQYIGRLMRNLDAEPIRAKLDELRGVDRVSHARFQQAERWRERLLSDGDAGLTDFLQRYPQADRAHLRRLLRQAALEAAEGRPPGGVRQLFRYLRELL